MTYKINETSQKNSNIVFIVCVIGMFGFIIASVLISQYYDPNQTKPDYCETYGRQHLIDMHMSLPYFVNENVASRICTEPVWVNACSGNRTDQFCYFAKSELKPLEF